MQTTDLAEFNRILDQLGLVFSKAVDDSLRRVYWDALKPLPLKIIRDAAAEHTAKGKFFPKPSELRPKYEKPDDSKFPQLYSPDWWEQRSRVLRDAFPRGLDTKSRRTLDVATFGVRPERDLEQQAAETYDRTWPPADYSSFPEAANGGRS